MFHCASSDMVGTEGTSGPLEAVQQARNPLLCYLCKDYFSEPCLLSCYHTFCAQCLQNKITDNKINCPICGSTTQLKDNCQLPPPDTLMRHLIDLANTDNPPCSNCDKRDRPSMFFCSTCGQALCTHCRENTHRAKMFSTHDVVHMSKCAKDGHRRCVAHGEQYIMFSNSQRAMLCVNCFRDTPSEARLHCVDIDTAYAQGCKNLERSLLSVRETQGLVRSGVVACRTLLDELHHNTNTEKSTIHSFCQGMQDSIAKTQAAMLLEVQRQYESKERVLHSQLVNLSSVIPVLQAHLILCHTFSGMATKFQFLDLVYAMIDRLNSISQLSQPIRPLQSSLIKTNYKSEFAQSLEPWIGKPLPPIPSTQTTQGGTEENTTPGGSQKKQITKLKSLDEGQFTNHCRTFETQMKELGAEVTGVKERLTQLQRDVAVLKRAAVQPLAKRHTNISKDCERLEATLHRFHMELDRMRGSFESLWQDQLRRIRLEQDIFQSQMGEVVRIRCEVKQLASITQELEPCVKRLSNQNLDEMININTLIDHITNMHSPDIKYILDHGSQKGSAVHSTATTPQPPEKEIKDICNDSKTDQYVRAQDHRIRGVLSHIMDKVRTKEDRKKSPVQEDRGILITRDREPSKERKESSGASGKTKAEAPKSCSIYHSLSGKTLQATQMQRPSEKQSEEAAFLMKKCIQEHLEEHIKQKLAQRSKSITKHKEFQDEDSDYQHISDATTIHTRAHVHKSATPPAVYPHSDTEDSVFYPDTPSSGRRSSTDLMDRRKTLVVVIGHGKGKGKGRMMQKQRSWETFPPKRRNHHYSSSKFCHDPESFRGAFDLNGLKKADSFEGHEEAVRTLVAAVQETRTMRKPKPPTTNMPDNSSA
ncbi:RING finger protein 207-like isoform X2 [Cimex lectularius]|uniref:RING finger protein 207 n=1 Tax=Cimex lectularius TaxID=79782 RepID=A0A8I6S4X4_CIMLE|nr:RING finger protein 207-like isoform X2 [Cimex lectularius]